MNVQENYQKKMSDLQTLMRTLESESLSIDDLMTKLEEAYHLIDFLKTQVTKTEARIIEVISARNSAASELQQD